MRRLYVQIYLAFVGVGLLVLLTAGGVAAALFGRPAEVHAQALAVVGYAVAGLPDPADDGFDDAFAALAAGIDHELTLWDRDGNQLASTGVVLPEGPPGLFHRREGVGLRVVLPDGKVLAAGRLPEERRLARFALWLVAVGLAVGVGCLPIARRVTRRLERLQRSVDAWGDGDLSRRAEVVGRDEVAAVARTFNRAADRVERHVVAQRRVLASASHELRSPLARLRMALELLDAPEPERRALVHDAIRDVEELDATVGDLLQVGRMMALQRPEDPLPVDLRAVVEEEARRVGAEVRGPPSIVAGDPVLLRRLVRNLFENAVRHGAPPIVATTTSTGLDVSDAGPGVPEALRERIFEPFFRPDGHAEGKDGGVGLGLHLVREIAAFHGATVDVRGDGPGATFEVRGLPSPTDGSGVS